MGVYYRKFRKTGRRIWWLSYTMNGRQVFESSHSTSRRFAEKLLAIRRAEIAEGRYNLPSSNPPRLNDWTTDFLATIRVTSTKNRYNSSIKQLLSFFGEKTRLTDISVSRIEAFKRKRLTDGLTPGGCNRDLALLRHLLNLAERQRLIARNPFSQVDMLDERKTRKQPHILTFEEQAKLSAVAAPHLRCLIALLVDTGLRVNCEALKLTWKDIDFDKSQIAIRESKTLSGRRICPLTETCKVELQRWRRLVAPEFSTFVLPNFKDPSKPLGSIRKTWSTALRNSKLSPFAIYNLRHTFASRLNAAGSSALTISQLLGHSGSSGIVQTYAKVLDDTRREAILRLEQLRDRQPVQHAGAEQHSVI